MNEDDTTLIVPKERRIEEKVTKWWHQRILAYVHTFGAFAWIVVAWLNPALHEMTWAWWTYCGSIVITWYGGSTFSVMRK